MKLRAKVGLCAERDHEVPVAFVHKPGVTLRNRSGFTRESHQGVPEFIGDILEEDSWVRRVRHACTLPTDADTVGEHSRSVRSDRSLARSRINGKVRLDPDTLDASRALYGENRGDACMRRVNAP